MEILIHGASDDVVDVIIDGDEGEQFDLTSDPIVLQIKDRQGYHLFVNADFDGEWRINVQSGSGPHGYPNWPIYFTERPDYEGDPALVIDAPDDANVSQVE